MTDGGHAGTPVHHVLTPGDHYSPRTGSAIPTVVHGLASGARTAGDTDRYPQRVVLQSGTYRPRYDSAEVLEYDGGTEPGPRGRYLDGIRGRLGLPRRAAAQYFRPATARLWHEPPGIVIAHNAPIVAWLLRNSAHTSVLYAHNDLLRSYSRAEAARVLGHAARIVCVSESLAAQTRRRLPQALHRRIRVVGNGVDTDLFAPASARPTGRLRVMFLGRTIPEKGADLLLAAAALVQRTDIEYVIVGSHGFDPSATLSRYELELRALATRVQAPVRFEPFVARSELPTLLATADVLVLPSRWSEPWGLTVGEGMASGVPVVASRTGGIPEVLGDVGILVDPDRPDQIASAIASLAAAPDARRQLSVAGRERALARDWAWSWHQLADVLDELSIERHHLT